MRQTCGGFGKNVARGLRLRCDWGPQYIADAWINEVKWLGITISPSYVGEPQCNGVAGALHADAEGAVTLPASLPVADRGAHDHRRVRESYRAFPSGVPETGSGTAGLSGMTAVAGRLGLEERWQLRGTFLQHRPVHDRIAPSSRPWTGIHRRVR